MDNAFGGRRNQGRVMQQNQCEDDFNLDDQVEVCIRERTLVGGAMLVYVLPLLPMLISMAVVSQFIAGDVAAAFGALFGFAGGLVVVRTHSQINRNNPVYQPSVLAKKPTSGPQLVAVLNSPHSV